MKKILVSCILAVVMVATICAITLPAYADTRIATHPYRWAYGYNINTDLRNQNVVLEWENVEPSPVENYIGSVRFLGDLYFAIGAGDNSYTLNTNDLRIEMDFKTLPEKFEVYSYDALILRWSYADPTNILLYSDQDYNTPYAVIPYSDIDVITFLFQWASIDTVVHEGLQSFYNFFGDYTLYDASIAQEYYDRGYQLGISNGYYDGTQDGYASGYLDGLSDGAGVDLDALKQENYDRGYAQAEDDLLNSQTWGGNFLGNIFSAPWIGLTQFTLFETSAGIPVTLGGVLGAVIGVSFFIMFLKWFAGG